MRCGLERRVFGLNSERREEAKKKEKKSNETTAYGES
jgi:hypothetical protein